MKGENKLKILEFLAEGDQLISDLLFIFTLPYGTSYSRMDYLVAQRQGVWAKKIIKKEKKQNFYDLLYRLRKEGLISECKKNQGCFFKISSKGEKILEALRLKRANALPAASYKTESDNLLKIVIFDIPEKERRKRDWLRAALKNLEFNMLQKSVWAGKIKLPQEFLADLNKLNLLSYVEIFAISRTGSLKQLT